MRFPWISRQDHNDAVRKLELRIADLELERKKAQDELLRVLGAQPYNFPQRQTYNEAPETAAQEELTEQEQRRQKEDDWLDYLRRMRPSEFPQALAKVMHRRKMGDGFIPQPPPAVSTPTDVEKQKKVIQAFDEAESEARRVNGHAAAS